MMMNHSNLTAAVTLRSFSLMLTSLVALLVAGCGGSGSQDPDPLVEDFGMAYVRRPLVADSACPPQPAADIRNLEGYTCGGDLYYRDLAAPTAPQRNVTGVLTGGLGDVRDIEVSYDGTRLLFAMRMPDVPGLDPEDQPKWNLWEYNITADRLVSVLPPGTTSEDGQDVAPHYLPDGRIVFSSTRQRLSKAILLDEGTARAQAKPQFSAQDEDLVEHAMVLHVATVTRDANGDINGLVDIEQISMNQSHDLDPTVLSSGEILFSRWDHMGNRNAMSLYRVHPDGTELQIVYGAHSHATGTNGADVQFLQPREMPDGRILSVLLPFSNTFNGGDLVLIDTANYIDNTYPVLANIGVLSGPAQQPATTSQVTTDGSISPGGRYRSAWPLFDGTNRMLVSWSACRVLQNGVPQPCTAANLAANAGAPEPDPIYGIFLQDMDNNTRLPIVVPEEGVIFTDVVAAAPRPLPNILYDKQAGIELDQQSYDENVGILDIRSVYDIDGVDTAPGGIAVTADPVLTPVDSRPARFLRIVKAVGIPDDIVKQVPNTAFGRSRNQLMREIIGYTPVQPDGSVRVKVPANVPLAISVVDAAGQRIGSRHQNWLQLRPGENRVCTGCHDHISGVAHGHPEGPASVWAGATATGVPFPNTQAALSPDSGDTMAQTLTRLNPAALLPSVDVVFDDVWTDPALQAPTASFAWRYADLATPMPASAGCQSNWDRLCRIEIHYEQHIHPLWSVNRGPAGVNTCTNCHNTVDAGNAPMIPDAQLDLSDGLDPLQPAHFHAYHELLYPDTEKAIDGSEVTVPGPIDPVTGLPTQVPVPVTPSMSAAGARASPAFFSRFVSGGTHDGYLTAAELRLLAEWLDIGAQYYNDPFAVP